MICRPSHPARPWLCVALCLAVSVPAASLATDPAPAAPAAPPAADGTLVISADADDLVAEIKVAGGDARLVGLKKGDNRVELAAGDVVVSVSTKAGRRILDTKVAITGGGESRLDVKSRGTLVVEAPADADVSLDDRDVAAEGGVFKATATPGGHSLVVQRAGYYGMRGTVEVEVGKTARVATQFEAFDPGPKATIAWAGIIGGGALVVAAVAIDATSRFDEWGGDVARWTLLGTGAAAFVGGTVMLKHTMDEPAPIKDTRFSVQVARVKGGALAGLTLRF